MLDAVFFIGRFDLIVIGVNISHSRVDVAVTEQGPDLLDIHAARCEFCGECSSESVRVHIVDAAPLLDLLQDELDPARLQPVAFRIGEERRRNI